MVMSGEPDRESHTSGKKAKSKRKKTKRRRRNTKTKRESKGKKRENAQNTRNVKEILPVLSDFQIEVVLIQYEEY